jgi:hypothetical protein
MMGIAITLPAIQSVLLMHVYTLASGQLYILLHDQHTDIVPPFKQKITLTEFIVVLHLCLKNVSIYSRLL